MKRLICLVGILGIGLALAGCSDNDNKASAADKETSLTDQLSRNDPTIMNFSKIGAKIVTDPDTGVEYIETYVTKEKGGGVCVTPRLAKDGKPFINPKWWENK